MTRLVALLGDPVAHSLSPSIQNAAFEREGLDARYVALRCGAEDLAGLLRGIARAGGAGNVTLPHKEEAARLVERPGESVVRTGACNTFWLEDGRLCGENTDVEGVRGAVAELLGREPLGARVLLLGAGGAARAAVHALLGAGADRIVIRNRTVERAEALVRSVDGRAARSRLLVEDGPIDRPLDSPFDLIVHATPLGLRDDDPLPISPDRVEAPTPFLDLVYRPGETAWVRAARAAGHPADDGGGMLVLQGAAAFRCWWGRPAPLEVMRDALAALREVPAPRP